MPPPAAWLAQVENAHSVADLVRTLRDYLSSLSREEMAQLPDGIRLGSLDTAAQVHEWAVILAHHDLRSGADAPQALHRSAVVFAAAGARMPKLAG